MAVPIRVRIIGTGANRPLLRGLSAALATAVIVVLITSGGASAIMTNVGSGTSSATSPTTSSSAAEPTAPKVVASCGVGKGPMGVAYDPADKDVYVANSNLLTGWPPHHHGTISVIEPGCKVVHTITLPAGSCPYGLAYDPENQWMYAIDSCLPFVYIISGTEIIHRIQFGGPTNPFGGELSIAYDPLTGDILVSDLFQDGSGILAYHGTRQTGEMCGQAGWECPSYDSIAVVDGKIFAGSPNPIVVFDARTYAFLKWFTVPCDLYGQVLGAMAFDPASRVVYFGDTSTGTYCVFSPKTDEVLYNRTISSLHAAAGIAYSPATRGIYIVPGGGPNPWLGFTQNSSDVWEVDPSGHLYALHLAMDANAYALAYSPPDGMMYICGAGTDSVYVVS